jgi:type IV pilus assembly protein PilV
MKQTINNSSGFTLIEVLIASVMIVFGLLAMASFLGNLVNKNAANERKTMATVLAEEKIEDLRNDALTLDLNAADNDNDIIATAAGSFTRTWTIVEDFADLTDQVTVLVDWDGVGNSQVTLITLINN